MKKILFTLFVLAFVSSLCFGQEPSVPVTKTTTTPEPTAVASGVSLFVPCDGREGSKVFTDYSRNNYTVTANGDTQVSTSQNKFGTGSAVLNGKGDYLAVEDSADWDFGTADFTVDFWIRFNAVSSAQFIFDVGGSQTGSRKGIGLYYKNNEWWIAINDSYPLQITGNIPEVDTWYHIAIVRNNGTLHLFKDGVSIGRVADTSDITDSTEGITIGTWCGRNNYFVNGWIDEFRISKGVARWTENFNPPTATYDVK